MPKETVLALPLPANSITGASVLRLPRVIAKTSLSRSTIYALQKHGAFPQAIQLGGRAVGWLSSEIDQWLVERAIARKEVA